MADPSDSKSGSIAALCSAASAAVLIAAASCAFFLHGAAAESIWAKDLQGLRAEIVREMVATGEWLIPHLNGQPYLTKPPLYYWLAALSAKALGGPTEYALRLPSIAGGFLAALFTYLVGTRLFSRRVGFLAALLFIAAPLTVQTARAINLDMTLSWLVTAAMYCLVRAAKGNGESRGWVIAAFALTGLTALTKGPVGLLVIAPAALFLWRTGEEGSRPSRAAIGGGLLVFLAVVVPWGIAALRVENLGATLYEETLFRYQRSSLASPTTRPVYFYLPALAVGFLPWSLFLPAAIVDGAAAVRRRLPARRELLFLVAWIAPALAVFSVTSSKRPWYLLPLLPAVALGTAWALDRFFLPEGSPWARRLAAAASWGAGALFLGLGCLAPFAAHRIVPDRIAAGIATGIAVVALAACSVWLFRRRRRSAVGSLALALLATWWGWQATLAPAVDGYRTRKEFFREAARIAGPAPLFTFRYNGYDLQFYAARTVPVVEEEQAVMEILRSPAQAYLILEERDVDPLRALGVRVALEHVWTDPWNARVSKRMYLVSN